MKTYLSLLVGCALALSFVTSTMAPAQAKGYRVHASDVPLNTSEGAREFFDTLSRDGK